MTDNLRIWNAVSKTDPAHTKKVEFGRKFTSIDAHWQIMQATKQFGPIGEGWGYTVEHSIASIAPTMTLAIADVTLWWMPERHDGIAITGMDYKHRYGPIRATCEMWAVARDKGRMLFEVDGTTPKMRVDEDAPKKAMTDALTKGLSHLGFSADVFLGLFDDNRYVQKVTKEFAEGLPAEDAHLLKTPGDERSTYDVTVANKAQEWADGAVQRLNLTGTPGEAKMWRNEATQIPKGKKKAPLGWLKDNSPGQYLRVRQAYQNVTGEDIE